MYNFNSSISFFLVFIVESIKFARRSNLNRNEFQIIKLNNKMIEMIEILCYYEFE